MLNIQSVNTKFNNSFPVVNNLASQVYISERFVCKMWIKQYTFVVTFAEQYWVHGLEFLTFDTMHWLAFIAKQLRIMHESTWMTTFCHEWGDSGIASRVTKISLFTVTNVLFYFLHAIFCPDRTIPLKTIIDRWFRNCCKRRSFLTQHCDVTTVDLWRHENVGYWHCDAIFVDCSCTRKLAQRRSSLVNNNHEYRILTIRYSRLSVEEQGYLDASIC